VDRGAAEENDYMNAIRIIGTVILLMTTVMASTQPVGDPELRAGITLMRAVNTAEAAARGQTGKYLELADLLNHRMMGGVRAQVETNGTVVFYQGRQLRLVVSPDGSQYHAMVVPVDTCGSAIFSDERGLIYTGKVLDC
jgi:hypothetical protein